MKLTKTQKLTQKFRLIFFLTFFSLIGLNLTWQCGLQRGLLLTFLTWSFYILCLPLSNNAVITTAILRPFSRDAVRYAKFIPWAIALVLNVIVYIFVPYAYLMSATTFLLYRIIANPWPYWLIIITSGLGGLYSVYVVKNRRMLRHQFAQTIIFTLGAFTFVYLSYMELIIFFCAKTCA